MKPWKVAWWLRRAGYGHRRPLRKLKERLARWFRPLRLEELESRLAPTADLVYNWTTDHLYNPLSGANISLKVADHDSSTWLQIVDPSAPTPVVHEVELTADRSVEVKGGPLFSDVMTVDFAYVGATGPHSITVTFDGGGPDLLG